jgi:hypothetical protein
MTARRTCSQVAEVQLLSTDSWWLKLRYGPFGVMARNGSPVT